MVWQRARSPAGAGGQVGDTALRAVLRFHSEAMSAGVRHALGSFSEEELASIQDGYRLYGFNEITRLIATPLDEDADPDDLDESEEQLDDAYAEAVPLDQTLVQAFEAHLRANPGMYAPVQEQTDGIDN
jgi:hypothetical protein